MTHMDLIREKTGQDRRGECLEMHLYSNIPFVCFCHFKDGTLEILISVSMYVLSFKNTFLT